MKLKEKLNLKLEIKITNIIFLIIAGVINATGVMLFLMPAGILDGGLSGTSMLISTQTGLKISIFLACLNLPLFLIGFKKLGLSFVIYSSVAIISYSLMSLVYQTVANVGNVVFELMDKQILLGCIFGGIISGIGSGLTIRFGGAIDGVEVLAIMFAKKIGLTVGQFVMSYNMIIYCIACILMKDLATGMYSILSYAIGLKVVDFIVDGFDKGKSFTIITDMGEQVAEAISKQMGRGVTLVDSKGFYSGTQKTMLYCVVNRFETVKLKNIIAKVDSNAFISVGDISEVVGNKVKYSSPTIKEIHQKRKNIKNKTSDNEQ